MSSEPLQILLALGGWIVALTSIVIGYLERRTAREDEKLAKTLEYFDGGSQRRSVGIALVEGLWLKRTRHHDVLVPMLSNQLVYLLLVTKSTDAHQERTLVRMLDVFSQFPDLHGKFEDRCIDVCDAMYRKLQGEKGGLNMSKVFLERWMEKLGHPYDES